MIDLTKPVKCDGILMEYLRYEDDECIKIVDYDKDWYWLSDGTPLGDWPPLTNVPPAEERWYVQMLSDGNKVGPVHNSEPADQKQVVKVAILGPGEPPLSYYASLHSELRIAKANAEADSTRIAALEGALNGMCKFLESAYWRENDPEHMASITQIVGSAKNLLNE